MGVQIESLPEDAVLNAYYPLFSDYFTVYDGNSSLLGRIPDNDLRKQIVKTYTMAKGMVDSFRLNNDLVGKFEYANNIFNETQLEVHKKQASAHLALLTSSSKTLKSAHGCFKQEVSKLMSKLKENEILNGQN